MKQFIWTRSWVVLLGLFVGLDACTTPQAEPDLPDNWPTYRPVYAPYSDIRKVETLEPQPLKRPGKIYIKDRFLFINELERGIHVVDNTDPAHPAPIAFISIPGNHDMAAKGNTLYADNAIDLVALDISNPHSVRLSKRIENSFTATYHPAERNVKFECPDPEKGYVVRWELATIQNAKCYR
ncbi:LVIVD repeat-containing protein [Tellurirhabdus bombi]|uniref:hypothetical protein n=1 Tax=Tellurirhabdus bombi TaxID=2907205 RepID=UPI001F30E9C9|nr:hypothetical protein [Tellurirhabdus bombi]